MDNYRNMSRRDLVQRLQALEAGPLCPGSGASPATGPQAAEQLDKERRLTEAEEQIHLIRSVVEQGFSAVLITSAEAPDPRVVYANPAFFQATGYAPARVIGQPLSTLAGLTELQERLRSGLPQGEAFLEQSSTYQTAEGERWGEWRVGPVRDKHGRHAHWLAIFRDITEHKRLEKEILEISDRERQRLGQDLHDGLCQQLAGIELMSRTLEQKLAPRSKAGAAGAAEIARHVREAISQTRSLARGLSPVTLESEGLCSGLSELAATAERMFGVACRLSCPAPRQVRDPAAAMHLYRIAQEAVSNAIKHGKARRITIALESNAGRLRLTISDDGAGFPEVLPRGQGMGLRIMQYRAGMIGGSLSWRNSSEGGAAVICSAPAEPTPLWAGRRPTTKS
jgi:PAS domain S-box-containing protein